MPSARPGQFALTAPGALRLYSTEELLHLPPPEWLVRNTIPTGSFGSFSVVYGPSGAGKSFVALDLAMSIGSGLSWQGRQTEKGWGAYVSGEGIAGLGQRALAWLKGTGLDYTDVQVAWLIEALPVTPSSEEIDLLLARFDELASHYGEQPSFVILDTLARCFEGNENETEDMSNFVKGVDRIRLECGTAVIAIHHTNATESRERGNGALRAATDTMIQIMPGALGATMRGHSTQGMLTITCSKQKEALPFDRGIGHLVPVDGTKSVRLMVDWMGEETHD